MLSLELCVPQAELALVPQPAEQDSAAALDTSVPSSALAPVHPCVSPTGAAQTGQTTLLMSREC